MGIRVGIDVQSIDDVRASIVEFGDRYLERVYTPHERKSCVEDVRTSEAGFADRFAAKEAVMKVLDIADTPMSWMNIDIDMAATGAVNVSLSGVAHDRATELSMERLLVSVSHSNQFSTAVAIGEFAGNVEVGTR